MFRQYLLDSNIHTDYSHSHIYVEDTQVNHINLKKINQFIRQLHPLTLPFIDKDNRIIQIFKLGMNKLLGAILDIDNTVKVIPETKIHNALNLNEKASDLILRLESVPLRKWDIVLDIHKMTLFIWPHLEAAGKYDKMDFCDIRNHINKRIANITGGYQKVTRTGQLQHEHTGALNRYHYTAAQIEAKGGTIYREGKPLINPKDGKPFDHVRDVTNYQKAASGLIIDIKERMAQGYAKKDLKPDEIRELEKLLSKVSKIKDQSRRYAPSTKPKPAETQFREKLSKTGLVKSYNSSNPSNPIPEGKGKAKEIGGVGCSVKLIEGLFDGPEALFATEHSFFVPDSEDGEVPFSNEEMCQILHELADGIFVHGTVPFFSLHFNEDANLYPVIHPAYENTLVGQVISMLDYFMKGYLNGGVFKEAFVRSWADHPTKIEATPSTLQKLINFMAETERHQPEDLYLPVRQMLKLRELDFLEKLGEDPIFRDYTKFTNSFRIIAKQNKIQQTEGLFVLDSDFDVFYTIEPNPDYKRALEEYYKQYGSYPHSYQVLVDAFNAMQEMIHTQMAKLPLCKKYFAMLAVINFFSYYFMTLKEHHKLPILPQVTPKSAGSPALFPPLPLASFKKLDLVFDSALIFKGLLDDQYYSFFRVHGGISSKQSEVMLFNYLSRKLPNKEKELLIEMTAELIWQQIYDNTSESCQKSLLQRKTNLYPQYQKAAEKLLKDLDSIIDKRYRSSKDWEPGAPKPNIIIGYINHLLFAYKGQKIKFGTITLDEFQLPSEQSAEDIELGKRVVGGCGMDVTSMKVEPSPSSGIILDEAWKAMLQTSFGSWTRVRPQDASSPSGNIFTVPFFDIPLGFGEDGDSMKALLHASPDTVESFIAITDIANAMLEDNQAEFDSLIAEHPPEALVDGEKRTLLHHSALTKNTYFMSTLLNKGLSVSAEDHKKYLSIHYAVMEGHIDQLELLLSKNKSTLEACSNEGATPLIVAIQHEQLAAVDYLLKQGAKTQVKLNDGYTALHCAVHTGNEAIVKLLLEHPSFVSAQVNQVTNEGITPLMIAVRISSIFLSQYLLSKGADPKQLAKNGTSALDSAVKQNHLELCQLLAPLSTLTDISVQKALKKCSLEINILLMEQPNYLQVKNAIHDTPLLMAIRYANIPAALHLFTLNLSNGAISLDVKNKLGESPVMLAIKGRFFPFLVTLLKRGAQYDPKEFFLQLFKSGYDDPVPYLEVLFKNTNFDQATLNEFAYEALVAGNSWAIMFLLQPRGANLDAIRWPNDEKMGPYWIKKRGDVAFLQEHYGLTNDTLQQTGQADGKTFPYMAAESGRLSNIIFFIKKLKELGISWENHYKKKASFLWGHDKW